VIKINLAQFIFFTTFFCSIDVYSCGKDEVFITGHHVEGYVRSDGAKVESYYRKSYCRKIEKFNYFTDQDSNLSEAYKIKFKKWKKSEHKLIEDLLGQLPAWLKRNKLSKILRSSIIQGQARNPALIIPKTKTMIISDNFFARKNKKAVLIHEMSHIAVLDVDPSLLLRFFKVGGWSYTKGRNPSPPDKVIMDDSADSPSEDFANWVELYYTNAKKLKTFNEKQYQVLNKIIMIMEKSNG
jgi:hypothetical protein